MAHPPLAQVIRRIRKPSRSAGGAPDTDQALLDRKSVV